MRSLYSKLIPVFGLCVPFMLSVVQAEIPFSQAKGMLQYTDEDKRDYSPFWGMVAVHGKMLESIRFFGNYETGKTDQGRDAIAQLIKWLFNSPDGIQFVATTYEGDPVGNLSRHLGKINDIIEILLTEEVDSPKLKKLKEKMRKINAEIQKISRNKSPLSEEISKRLRDLKNKSQDTAKEMKKVTSETKKPKPKSDRIKQVLDSMIKMELLTDKKRDDLARQSISREVISQIKKDKGDSSQDNIASQVDNKINYMMPDDLDKTAFSQIELKNKEFSDLLVRAFNKQIDLANPDKPNEYLYPKNIVVTALLAFFVKVADSKDQLKDLKFLMDEDDFFLFMNEAPFTEEEYNQYQTEWWKNQIFTHQKTMNAYAELAFLMSRGYQEYENPLSDPVEYRSDTNYLTSPDFSDCGETSLRNVLMVFMSAGNAGRVTREALQKFINNIVKYNPGKNFNLPEYVHLHNLLKFFQNGKHSNISTASTKEVHDAWAQVVSNLNAGQNSHTLESVQYGNSSKEFGQISEREYEIMSNRHPQIKGIVSMFNVIAKLIPDGVLAEPWSVDRDERLTQVANKLDRLCELLSRKDLDLSWSIDEKEDENHEIDNEFIDIVFTLDGSPVLKWQFIKGHFLLDTLSTPKNDWRTNYNAIDEETFENEWMASLYLKLPAEKEYFDNARYGAKFPLALIYSPSLIKTDEALNALTFVLNRNYSDPDNVRLRSFLDLILRWIIKSISLYDDYSFDKLTLLLYSCNTHDKIMDILKREEFSDMRDEVSRYVDVEEDNPGFIMDLLIKSENFTISLFVSKKGIKVDELTLKNTKMEFLNSLLKNFPEVKFLDISNTIFSSKDLTIFQDRLKDSHVNNLSMGNNSFPLKDWFYVLEGTPVSTLSLGYGGFKNKYPTFMNFGSGLKGTSIRSLKLNYKKLTAQEMIDLVRGLKDTSVTSLSFDTLGPLAMVGLVQGLMDTPIMSLDLDGSMIDIQGMKILAQGLKDTSLISLNLRGNNIQKAGAAYLAQGLKGTPIMTLSLGLNNIGFDGIKSFIQKLKDTSVTTLDLSYKENPKDFFERRKITTLVDSTPLNDLTLAALNNFDSSLIEFAKNENPKLKIILND